MKCGLIYNKNRGYTDYDISDLKKVNMWIAWSWIPALLLFASETSQAGSAVESHLGLGKAVNVFVRYGYLSISMRVVPRNDTDRTWIFREPTVSAFRGIEHLEGRRTPAQRGVFHGDFHMEFCDNVRQLLQAYFRDFRFERLEKPWRAFTASWLAETTARHLGINSSFIQGDHCYVLVRVSRFRESAALVEPLPPSVILEDSVAQGAHSVLDGDTMSAAEFMRTYGSHYVASYVTGNSLYQVFVYNRSKYVQIKERLKSHGVADLSSLELLNYFSPWYAEHMGTIRCASGNATVEQWAANTLRVQYYIFRYASLLKLHKDATLLKTLDGLLRNEALLQLDLRTLTPAFKDPIKKKWFEEVIDNFLKLWEVNM